MSGRHKSETGVRSVGVGAMGKIRIYIKGNTYDYTVIKTRGLYIKKSRDIRKG